VLACVHHFEKSKIRFLSGNALFIPLKVKGKIVRAFFN